MIFVSIGKPARATDVNEVDWVPSTNLPEPDDSSSDTSDSLSIVSSLCSNSSSSVSSVPEGKSQSPTPPSIKNVQGSLNLSPVIQKVDVQADRQTRRLPKIFKIHLIWSVQFLRVLMLVWHHRRPPRVSQTVKVQAGRKLHVQPEINKMRFD